MVIDFNTEQGRYAFVKMSDTCVKAEVDCKIYTSIYDVTNGINGPIISNQEIDISIIGFVKDLTEKDWSRVVDSIEAAFSKDILGYQDYLDFGYSSKNTATESGKSLMDNLEVYLENPVSYPENPEDQSWIEAWQHCGERTSNWLLIQYN